jgi:hypothetical protein
MAGFGLISILVLLIALTYQFPYVVGTVLVLIYGSYQYYLKFLCIKASRSPRKSLMTDTAQRLKSYPPVYPNGWYHLANCDEIGKGEVLQVEGVGRKFAVWRSAKGEVWMIVLLSPSFATLIFSKSILALRIGCFLPAWRCESLWWESCWRKLALSFPFLGVCYHWCSG